MRFELTDEVREEAFAYVDAVLASARGTNDGSAASKSAASTLYPFG